MTPFAGMMLLVEATPFSSGNDIVLAGTPPSIGQVLDYDGQSDDWGDDALSDMCYYDATEDLGQWNASEDCIFLAAIKLKQVNISLPMTINI